MTRKLLLLFANYSILLLCVLGFSAGSLTILALPIFQILLSCVNYHYGKSWVSVLIWEVHLLLSTIMGIFLNGYLYLKYIYYDAEGVLVFATELQIGFFLVLILGFITILIKLISQKRQKSE